MYIIYIIYLFIYVYTVYVLDILRCICLGITTIPIQKTNGAPTIPMRSFAARKERDELSMAWRYTQIQYLQKLDLLQILEILYISVYSQLSETAGFVAFSERYQASEVLYHHGPPSNKICRLGRPLPLDENAYVSSNYSTQHARVYFFIHYRCRYMYIIVY